MSGFDEVARAFVAHFYQTLDSNPAALAGLYQPTSVVTFDGTMHTGPDAIIGKLVTIGGMQHNMPQLTMDVQPCPGGQSMIIFVTGQFMIGGQTNALLFSQVFHLVATGPGQYFISNEVFRTMYA